MFSELLGTFFLVLVAAGGGIVNAQGQISVAAVVAAPGLMVVAIILFIDGVSGAVHCWSTLCGILRMRLQDEG